MNSIMKSYLESHADEHVRDLQALLRFPSIAAHTNDIEDCAAWLADFMAGWGAPPDLLRNGGNPVLLAEIPGRSPKTLLVYLHYDVQPADEPEWRSDPFGGEVRDGRIYGRGAVDNKGPVMAVLEALRAYHTCGVRPPVTVRFLCEGEEEVGSPSLPGILRQYHDRIASDAMVNFDDNVWVDGRPRVVCGIKGIAKIRLEVRTRREFHAMMSPLIENAAWRLVWALNTLVAPDGRILIRDFYADVVPPQPRDVALLAQLGWSGDELLAASGQTAFVGGVNGTEALTRLYLEPTINLGGIHSGYVLPEQKGVVPAFAAAEMRVGTVPNQTPERVLALVRAHLDAAGFGDVAASLVSRNPWARTTVDSPIAQALQRSLAAAFERDVVLFPTYPGSGPEGVFQELFPDMQQAYSGFGPTEDNLHAPNEYIVIADYLRGIETVARLLEEYSAD
ncbi:MAG: M20/M25/M40 family metallo-hydrolase [Anaerolineae bacterium]